MIIAELETDGWELLSAVEEHERSTAFEIPSMNERLDLSPGMRVKLLFSMLKLGADKPTIEVEGLWVTITERYNSIYQGVLDEDPVTRSVLKAGSELFFTPDHVCSILITGPQD